MGISKISLQNHLFGASPSGSQRWDEIGERQRGVLFLFLCYRKVNAGLWSLLQIPYFYFKVLTCQLFHISQLKTPTLLPERVGRPPLALLRSFNCIACLTVNSFHRGKPGMALGLWTPSFCCLLEAQPFSGLNVCWPESWIVLISMDKSRETRPPDLRRDWDLQMNRSQEMLLSWDNNYANCCLFFINRPQVLVRKNNDTPNIRIQRPEDDEKHS